MSIVERYEPITSYTRRNLEMPMFPRTFCAQEPFVFEQALKVDYSQMRNKAEIVARLNQAAMPVRQPERLHDNTNKIVFMRPAGKNDNFVLEFERKNARDIAAKCPTVVLPGAEMQLVNPLYVLQSDRTPRAHNFTAAPIAPDVELFGEAKSFYKSPPKVLQDMHTPVAQNAELGLFQNHSLNVQRQSFRNILPQRPQVRQLHDVITNTNKFYPPRKNPLAWNMASKRPSVY